jgi:hypothetical protein
MKRNSYLPYALGAAVLIAAVFAIMSRAATVSAQAPTDCAGVDLVLLIDESASMQDNDKESSRIDAARLAIDSLGDNILYSCPDVKHRIAVIGFWDEWQGAKDTAVYVNSLVAPTVEKFDVWVKQRDQIKALLDKRKISDVGTDHLSALKAAAQVLDEWRKQPPPDATVRRQGVVLVTDGGPCVVDLGCADKNDTFDRTAYMNDLTQLIDPNGATFPWRGADNPASIRLWFIGFRDTKADPKFDYLSPDSPWGKMFRPRWEQLANAHGGTVAVLDASSPNTTNRDVAPKIADIVDSVTGTSLIKAKCNEPFYVDPYTDKLRVRILKIGSNSNVPLGDVKVNLVYGRPLGTGVFAQGRRQGAVGGAVGDYRSDGPNEVYVIQDPAPGEWRIEVAGADQCRDLNVSYQPLAVRGSVVKPLATEAISQYDEGEFSDPGAPLSFEYRVVSGDVITKSIVPIPQFPLTMSVELRAGDKLLQTLDLQRSTDGLWRSVVPIKLPVAGSYTWSLVGRAPDGQQKKQVSVVEDSGMFRVSPVKRFHMEVTSPVAGAPEPLNRIDGGKQSPVAIRVAARAIDDETGKPLSQRQIQGASKEPLFHANVAAGSATSDLTPMMYNAVDMQWEAELVTGQNNVPDAAGKQTVTVQLNEQGYDKAAYRPSGAKGRSNQVAIERYRIIPVELTVSPASFDKPAYKGTAACIGAKVIPIQVDLVVSDAQRKTRLKPADVTAGDLARLASVRLVDPADNRVIEEGRWQVVETKDGAALRATLGITNAVAGKFEVQVAPNEKDLRNQYQLLRPETVVVPVTRSLSLPDDPRACQGASYVGLLLLAGLAVFVAYNLRGRPTGFLELVDAGTQIPYVSVALGGIFRHLFKRSERIGIGQKGLGFSHVEVRKSSVEGTRAISLDAYDETGRTMLSGAILQPGEEQVYLTEDVTARYS